MKRILPIAFAFALAGTLLSGCDRDQNRPAGSGGTTSTSPSSSPSGSASGSSSGSTSSQPKKTTPAPTSPSGGTSGSGSTTGK